MRKKYKIVCVGCRVAVVHWRGKRCVQCNVKAKARVEADTEKMIKWTQKEFGKQEAYLSILAGEGIRVINDNE